MLEEENIEKNSLFPEENGPTVGSGNQLLEPTRDFVFKNIFGVERNRRIVVSFLNAVLEGNPKISSIEFGNSEIPRARKDGKSVRLDILARTPDDTIINIEIQRIDRGDTENRAHIYESRIIPDKLEIGQDYNDIPNIILIWVTDFILYPDAESYLSEHTSVRLPRGNDPMKIGTRKSRTFILELPKIVYSVENLSNIEKDLLQLWMTFIKKPEIITEDIINQLPEIGEAMAELKRLSSDRTARALYEAELRAENDRIADNASALKRGISEGMMKGKMEGMMEGARRTALSMLMEGLPSSLVARCTGLTIDEIRKLENQLRKA